MTTVYILSFYFKKLGVGTAPASAPTIKVRNIVTDTLLVDGGAMVSSAVIPGACDYLYTGADNLRLEGFAHTTDTTMDEQDLFCGITTDVNVSVAVSSVTADAANTGVLAVRAGYTFDITVDSTVTADLSAATKLWMALKRFGTEDDDSLLFIEKSGASTAVIRANGQAYTTLTDGSLTVTGSSGDWHIAIHFDEAVTSLLFGINDTKLTAAVKALVSGNTVAVWEDVSNDYRGGSSITDGVVRTYA